jgi:hypothetical protein
MAEYRVAEAPPGTFMIAVALCFAVVVGVAYWFVRAYRRWRRANHPFARSFARIDRMGTTYRDRRSNQPKWFKLSGTWFERSSTIGRAWSRGPRTVKGTETPIRLMTCIFRVTCDVTPRREASAGGSFPRGRGSPEQAKPERLVLGLEDPYRGQSPT